MSNAGISIPFGTYTLFVIFAITYNGLYIPSKIYSIKPGPNSTDNGSFVLNTGSPTVNPDVSS